MAQHTNLDSHRLDHSLHKFGRFFIIDLLSGGDALNGRVQDGRFYLGDHGHFTEVSRRFFEYSRIHALSVFILTPIAILVCGSYLARHKDAKFKVGHL